MKTYTIGQFSKLINRHVRTIQKWDSDNQLKSFRTSTGRRYYTDDQYNEFMGIKKKNEDKKTVAYCRVSSSSQKEDLKSQKEFIKQFCLNAGIFIDDWVEDIGSGLNFSRKNFVQMMDSVEQKQIKQIIIAHKDRLIRFGFDWFKNFCSKHDCEIKIINNDNYSSEEELTKDLLSIIHCFSSRLYGLRKYKKKILELAKTHEENN